MNKIDHQNEHFEQIAERYYEARQGKKHLLYKRLLLKYMLSDVGHQINNQKKIAVLEPMCGYGEGRDIVKRFIVKDIEYEGFDYNDTLIEKVKKDNPDINIYKQDVTKFSTEKKFDIVILIGGLHHVHDYARDVVKNIGGMLKYGGYLLILNPLTTTHLQH